ncbi:disease resistance protein RGA2-like [Papaver somniferum]|uniref:disease resistance protein RGA2-like n=1 Tax=Papaver somniferum TaxID=3469 RepID=UPI000E6FFC98|nr:disease resistance protein RGA2-like [Papaver somniferum]
MAFEGVLTNGASDMLKNLVTLLGNEISLAWGVKDDLRMLKQTLEVIEAKTSDAETKQVNDAAVSLWLKMLKQVSYDADDLLDEFSYEAMRRSHHKKRRDADKSEIVKLLTTMSMSSPSSLPSNSSVNSNIHENVSVISIVGMGGLGKTSLAQSIYNDKSVEKYFEKKMWVCISDDFDVFKILKNIMESATGSRCQDFSNFDVFVKKVIEELQGTKYLLVLDDLWNEDPIEWNKLKSVLDCCVSVGSKIIITTRSQTVASVVQGLIPPYNLNVLSEAECWSIIQNRAFSA